MRFEPAAASADTPPLAVAAAKVGDRWALLVVEALLDAPRRFGELRAAVPGIAPNVLSQRLKHLEREGVVVARAYTRRPPRFAYALTALGEELAGVVRLLAAWGTAAGGADPPAHQLCGTALEPRWHCPTCDVTLPDPDPDELRYL